MENNNHDQPLLHQEGSDKDSLARKSADQPARSPFSAGEGDTAPITGFGVFCREFWVEERKLWSIAGPAVSGVLCRYSLGAVTLVFAGHLGTLDLDAVSVENSVIAGFSFGVTLGMGSALETLCGQAYGGGQLDMLGVYLQRSWIILTATGLILSPLYIFAAPLLRLIGQTAAIAEAAGTFAQWMIPQLFAYAFNFPTMKFLQSQRRMVITAAVSAATLVLHTALSWVFMFKLGWGLAGAAVVLNLSWWLIVAAQLVYIFVGTCGRAWAGFTWKAFENLWGFVRLSLASAVMLCLETWYFTTLILFGGYLKNAQVSVGALSICMNILGWANMAALGLNTAVSVRVSNELGAVHPGTAKFSVVVAIINSIFIGLLLSLILVIFRHQYPSLFSNGTDVKNIVYELTPLLAITIVANNVQPVLSGVAVGAGWQAFVAYVNIGCYYFFGIPIGLILGFKLDMGVRGIWLGMLSGTIVQTCVLFGMVYKTNWNKEASIAEDRIRMWRRPLEDEPEFDAER